MTTAKFLAEWLDSKATVRPKTLASYRAKVNHHLAPAIGHIQLVKLQPRHVEKMMRSQLAAGVPSQSVGHHLAVLRNALNTAMRWGYVARNVASLVSAPPVPGSLVRALSTDDAKRVLEAVHGDRHETLFTVALVCGLRQSEALGLTWNDVDLSVGNLRVWQTMQRADGEYRFMPTKTAHSTRTVVIPELVAVSLKAHKTRQNEERLRAVR